jgi:hypothetical protein
LSKNDPSESKFVVRVGLPVGRPESQNIFQQVEGYLITPKTLSEAQQSNFKVIDDDFLKNTQTPRLIHALRHPDLYRAEPKMLVFPVMTTSKSTIGMSRIGRIVKHNAWISGSCGLISGKNSLETMDLLWLLLQTEEGQNALLQFPRMKKSKLTANIRRFNARDTGIALERFFSDQGPGKNLQKTLEKFDKQIESLEVQRAKIISERAKLLERCFENWN